MLLLATTGYALFLAAGSELSEAIGTHELQAHVYKLASPEFQGRRGAGGARTARYIEAAFRSMGLKPAFGGSFSQPIPSLLRSPDEKGGSFLGHNVGALLPGSDPELSKEWIVLNAHYDHLGRSGLTYYPGADDNASGVAMLLEVAEAFALAKQKPKRTVLFVAFDLEESGLLGSMHFVVHPPLTIRQCKASVTADMIGRSMVNLMDEYVFALGMENSPGMRRVLDETKPAQGLRVARIGADIIGTRSDYGPFRDRHVPFVFFSTGQHEDYHQITDYPERVDYVKLQRISEFIRDVVRHLANDSEPPKWDPKAGGPEIGEAQAILELVERVLKHPQLFPLNEKQRPVVIGVQEKLRAIVKRGKVTEAERTWLVWTARILMTTVF
ncbi:MAG TPA: M20/M25/M40 family metallo-hydrolase [Gemmataceae bacterium]|nr:M20/M25/M40 family metallo-hydrolase [Gemmataceae bacterium]